MWEYINSNPEIQKKPLDTPISWSDFDSSLDDLKKDIQKNEESAYNYIYDIMPPNLLTKTLVENLSIIPAHLVWLLESVGFKFKHDFVLESPDGQQYNFNKWKNAKFIEIRRFFRENWTILVVIIIGQDDSIRKWEFGFNQKEGFYYWKMIYPKWKSKDMYKVNIDDLQKRWPLNNLETTKKHH